MKQTFHTGLASLLFAGVFGLSPTLAAEGDVGTQAYAWTDYSNLAPTPATFSLANYQGKVVLLVVFQYSCGGCLGNAPRFGRLADTLQSGAEGSKFQAVGAEIFNGTYAQIQTYRTQLTNNNTLVINFPSVHVPHDTAIAANDGTGEKWKRYNSYRDVYFVIDHTGKITARVEGNRANAMTNTQYNTLRTALNTAIAAVPVSIGIAPAAKVSGGLKIFQRGRNFQFEPGTLQAPVSLKILDLQGRNVRTLILARTGSLIWDGKDAAGKAVPFGTYLVRAHDGKISTSQRMNVLP